MRIRAKTLLFTVVAVLACWTATAQEPVDHAQRAEVEAIFRRVCAGLKRTQNPATGVWFTVVDKPDAPGNWIDSSGTASNAAGRIACLDLRKTRDLRTGNWNL